MSIISKSGSVAVLYRSMGNNQRFLKSIILKAIIKLTPNILIIWVANFVLKGIAELVEFDFDIDARKVFVKTLLYGETDMIEVSFQDFALFHDGEGYRFVIHHGHSDRPWLNNLLAHVIGKAWKIPELPQFSAQMELVAELLKAQPPALQQAED